MLVTKDSRSMLPKTVTYTVDPEEGEYTFSVIVEKPIATGDVICIQDGETCGHANAVREHLKRPTVATPASTEVKPDAP